MRPLGLSWLVIWQVSNLGKVTEYNIESGSTLGIFSQEIQ